MGVSLLGDQSDHIHVDVGEVADVPNQSHLTKIVIGVEGEELQDEKEEDILTSVTRPESPEEILMQVRGCMYLLSCSNAILYCYISVKEAL